MLFATSTRWECSFNLNGQFSLTACGCHFQGEAVLTSLATTSVTYHTELSCSVLSLRRMAWVGFFAGLFPGLCDVLWWLLWLGLSTNSWWLEWASNPEEQQRATNEQEDIRGDVLQHFLTESPMKEEKWAEELVETLPRFWKLGNVWKKSKNAVWLGVFCFLFFFWFVWFLIFKCLCLFVSVSVWVIVMLHLKKSILHWSDTPCCEVNLFLRSLFIVWTPWGVAGT